MSTKTLSIVLIVVCNKGFGPDVHDVLLGLPAGGVGCEDVI